MILLAVGWYLRFSLSYRDVEELLAERGLHAEHVTVWRWVQSLRKAVFKDRAQLCETDPSNGFFRTDSMSVMETATIRD
jgi:transposase, IS6 family